MARTVYYAAVSADGFIATKSGGVEWLEPFNSPELGYESFLATVGGVVLGRATYEQALTFGPWPYPGRRGLIIASRAIDGLPEGTRAVTPALFGSAFAELRAAAKGDVWVVGGGRAAALCLELGLIDELELYVVPRLLGEGVPLFASGQRWVELELLETRTFTNQLVKLRYRVDRRGDPARALSG
jgi:dihydrofolate reductase